MERAFQAEGTAQIKPRKEDPPGPNNGADIKIRNGEGKNDRVVS